MPESWHPRKTEKDVAVARAGVAKYDRGWKYGAGTRKHDHSKPGKGGEVLNPEQLFTRSRAADVVIHTDGTTIYADGPDGLINSGTDATTVIQAAVDAVGNGGTIFIGRGTYDLSSGDIVLGTYNNVKIRGAGRDVTILKNGGITKNSTTNSEGVEVEHLTIDVNQVSGRNALNFYGNSYNFAIRDLRLANTYDEFLLYYSAVDNFVCERVIFEEGGLGVAMDNAAGTQLTTTDGRSIFSNCVFLKDQSQGGGQLTTGGTGNLLIENCVFLEPTPGAGYAAVSIENSFGDCKKVEVKNCIGIGQDMSIRIGDSSTYSIEEGRIENCYTEDFQRIWGAEKAFISNATINNSYLTGVLARDCDRVVVDGIEIKNTNTAGDTTIFDKGGVYVRDCLRAHLGNITVEDTQGTATTPYGVYIHDYAGVGTKATLKDSSLLGTFTDYDIWLNGPTKVTIKDVETATGTLNIAGVGETVFENIEGYPTENSGTATFSGDGTTTAFTIAHGLAETPTYYSVEEASADAGAAEIDYITVDATNITVNFKAAPASGTGNVVLSWRAEVR